MAGTIKGIIVEIGGDTSGLQKALSKVNSVTSSLSKELRGVNSLLKLDPKNTELLAQKQEILNSQIAKTGDKLKQLEEIRKKAIEAQFNGQKISEEQWRNLQREIINTQNKLKNFKVEASNWTKAGKSIEEFGNKINNISVKIDNFGNKLTMSLTLPVVGGFTILTKSAMENEAAMQQVNNIYGESALAIADFAEKSAIAYNMSNKDVYKYSQVYGNLIQSITSDQQENAEMTQRLLKASSVIASATGRTMEDVMDRIRSGLLGNTEAIEDLGVNVNVALLQSTDAFKQFAGDKSWNQLDFQTQQQIRLFGILEQTTKKYGNEVNKNTSSSLQKLTARTTDLGSRLGNKLLPIAEKLISKADSFVDKLDDMDDATVSNILRTGLWVAAIGPVLKILGTAGKVVGTTSKGIGIFSQAIAITKNHTTSTVPAVNNLAKVFTALTSPVGIATTAITTSVALIASAVKKSEEETRESFENIGKGATDFITGIDTATSYLDSFSSTLFATNEEQQKLQNNMDEIQKGITEIAKTAADERRAYTQEEIIQLDEYFNKLRELKDRELQIQQQVAVAITQQATTVSESFKGSLEEYKVLSQQWIKTAQEQSSAEIELIQNRTIEEIALLNTRYGDKATLDNEAYAREYNLIQEKQTKAIETAQNEVAKVNEIYSNGYLSRASTDDNFYIKLQEYNAKVEELRDKHSKKIEEINNGNYNKELGYHQSLVFANADYRGNLEKTWKSMYKDMDESQEKQLGAWLAMVSQTEIYGGQIDKETRTIVDNIISSFDEMPKDTKKTMKDSMQGMLDAIAEKEPSLLTKAFSIGTNFISKLKKSLDVHSPSRKTKEVFKNVMLGAEEGLDSQSQSLYNKISTISKNLLSRFEDGSLANKLGAEIYDKTRNVFTTPSIVFNVQKMDESNLNTAFNYINKRLGSNY